MIMFCFFRDGITANCADEDNYSGFILKLRSQTTFFLEDKTYEYDPETDQIVGEELKVIVYPNNKEFHFIKL